MRSLVALLLLAAPFEHGRGQLPADVDPFYWPYAPIFGSGVYRQTDATETRIVRIAPSVAVRETRERSGPDVGVRLLLPFTVGIQHLDEEELPAGRSRRELEQVAFLPGVELEFPGERWTLRVRGELGWGTELEGEERSAVMMAVGVRSRFVWPEAVGSPALISGLKWGGFEPEGGEQRSLVRLTQALEFDVPVPRWKFNDEVMHLMPHVLGDWFYRPPEWLDLGNEGYEHVETEWQLGVAVRRETGFKIMRFEFDGVGVAYRFSEHSRGIKIYLNSVF